MQAVREGGRRVPQDVAVVGFDDIPLAAHTEPPLTTVHQPMREMGEAAARMLLAHFERHTRCPTTHRHPDHPDRPRLNRPGSPDRRRTAQHGVTDSGGGTAAPSRRRRPADTDPLGAAVPMRAFHATMHLLTRLSETSANDAQENRCEQDAVALALAGLLAAAAWLPAVAATPNTRTADAGNAATVLNVGMPNGPQTENHNPFLAPPRAPRSATGG